GAGTAGYRRLAYGTRKRAAKRCRASKSPGNGYIGGTTPSLPIVTRSARNVPSAWREAIANRCTPGFSCDRSPGPSLTTVASVGTTTDFSPSLYFSVSLRPATLATVALVIVLGDFPPAPPTPVTVALVIVVPGCRSHGR